MLKRWRINLKNKKIKLEKEKKFKVKKGLGTYLLLPFIFVGGHLVDFHVKPNKKIYVQNKLNKSLVVKKKVDLGIVKGKKSSALVTKSLLTNISEVSKYSLNNVITLKDYKKNYEVKDISKLVDKKEIFKKKLSKKEVVHLSFKRFETKKNIVINGVTKSKKKKISSFKKNIKNDDLIKEKKEVAFMADFVKKNKDKKVSIVSETKKLKKLNLDSIEKLLKKSEEKLSLLSYKISTCTVYNHFYGYEFDLKYIEYSLLKLNEIDLSNFIIDDKDRKKEIDDNLKSILKKILKEKEVIEAKKKLLLMRKEEKKVILKKEEKLEKKKEKKEKVDELIREKEYVVKMIQENMVILISYNKDLLKSKNRKMTLLSYLNFFGKKAFSNMFVPAMLFSNPLVAELVSMTLITNDLLSMKGLINREKIKFSILNNYDFIDISKSIHNTCIRNLDEISAIKSYIKNIGFSNNELSELVSNLDDIERMTINKIKELENHIALTQEHIKVLKRSA